MIALLLLALGAAAPDGTIAYVARENGAPPALYLVDVRSGEVRPAGLEEVRGAPVWSPAGDRLAIPARDGEHGRIYIHTRGSGGHFLRDSSPDAHTPVWSQDGERLAYSVGPPTGSRIAVYDLKNGSERIWAPATVGLLRPAWIGNEPLYAALSGVAPEEGQSFVPALVAVHRRPGRSAGFDLVLVHEAGISPVDDKVLPSAKGDYAEWLPRPSPRDPELVFESNDGGDRELFLFTRYGTIDISNHREADWNPVWSPDGEWIAFESFRGGQRRVHAVHRKTRGVFALAADVPGEQFAPSWAPGSDWIAFVARSGDRTDLFACPVAGGESVRLTNDDAEELSAGWSR